MTRRWIGLLVGASCSMGIALAAQGCTVTTGTIDDFDFDSGVSSPDASTSGDTGARAPTTCNECLANDCTTQWVNCQSDTGCQTMYFCATAAGANVNACFCAGTAESQRRYAALSQCNFDAMCGTCQSLCASSGPTCPAPRFPTAQEAGCVVGDGGTTSDAAPPDDAGSVTACKTCTQAKCPSEDAACATGTDCGKYLQCITGCADANCAQQCRTTFASGAGASDALLVCTGTNCTAECL